VDRFPSLKAKRLLRILQAAPLGYRIVRQKGSHRVMEAPGRSTLVFAFHDNQTIRPSTVKDILCDQVGLARLNESQRLEDLESHVALNPELGSGEEEEESESDY